jgi:hypothetical protein
MAGALPIASTTLEPSRLTALAELGKHLIPTTNMMTTRGGQFGKINELKKDLLQDHGP